MLFFFVIDFGEFSEETFTKVFKKENLKKKQVFFGLLGRRFNGVFEPERNKPRHLFCDGFLLICHQLNLWMLLCWGGKCLEENGIKQEDEWEKTANIDCPCFTSKINQQKCLWHLDGFWDLHLPTFQRLN